MEIRRTPLCLQHNYLRKAVRIFGRSQFRIKYIFSFSQVAENSWMLRARLGLQGFQESGIEHIVKFYRGNFGVVHLYGIQWISGLKPVLLILLLLVITETLWFIEIATVGWKAFGIVANKN